MLVLVSASAVFMCRSPECATTFSAHAGCRSETVREKRWDWYRDDFCGRLFQVPRILMNTRWHEEDDLAGREIAQFAPGRSKARSLTSRRLPTLKTRWPQRRRISVGRAERV